MNSFCSRVESKKPVTLLKSNSFENVSQGSRLFHCLFFDNVAGLDALGIASKLYSSVAKELSQKVLEANSYVYRSYRGKTGRGVFLPFPSSGIGLKRDPDTGVFLRILRNFKHLLNFGPSNTRNLATHFY